MNQNERAVLKIHDVQQALLLIRKLVDPQMSPWYCKRRSNVQSCARMRIDSTYIRCTKCCGWRRLVIAPPQER